MANRDLNESERVALETLIDNADLAAVLMALSEICAEKAEHVRTQWGDNLLARYWDTAAGEIGCTVATRAVMLVSHS